MSMEAMTDEYIQRIVRVLEESGTLNDVNRLRADHPEIHSLAVNVGVAAFIVGMHHERSGKSKLLTEGLINA